jgi:hypothetical protein
MRRSSLGLVLIALNVSLALLAVAGWRLRRPRCFAASPTTQALERVRVAASAPSAASRRGRELATMTRCSLSAQRRRRARHRALRRRSADSSDSRRGGLTAAPCCEAGSRSPRQDRRSIGPRSPEPRRAWSLVRPAREARADVRGAAGADPATCSRCAKRARCGLRIGAERARSARR